MACDDLIIATPCGLHCPPGDFYIDPWRPVDRAVITHAHADHARRGHAAYLAHTQGENVLRSRLGADIKLQTLQYGEAVTINGVRVSLHPAGHVLGSAQVRVEHAGRVWVASGDYKLDADPTCAPFEPVRCDVFITESTFGLPIYRWPQPAELFDDLNAWWRANADAGRASVVYAYAFGKAQRLLAGVDASIGPIVCHGTVEVLNDAYRASGLVLSGHADWPSLMRAIGATGAERVIVTHGSIPVMVRWLTEQGLQAEAFATQYGGDDDDGVPDAPETASYNALDAATPEPVPTAPNLL